MENVVSNPLWQVLGRCCCQAAFRKTLFAQANTSVSGPTHMQDGLLNLYPQVVGPSGAAATPGETAYRCSRFDFMEVNAFLTSRVPDPMIVDIRKLTGVTIHGLLGKDGDTAVAGDAGLLQVVGERIAGAFGGTEPTSGEVFELVGLLCIDHLYLNNATGNTGDLGALSTFLSDNPPFFMIAGSDLLGVKALLVDTVLQSLFERVDLTDWRLRPDAQTQLTACATGFTLTRMYRHFRQAPAAITALALQELLASQASRDVIHLDDGTRSSDLLEELLTRFIGGFASIAVEDRVPTLEEAMEAMKRFADGEQDDSPAT